MSKATLLTENDLMALAKKYRQGANSVVGQRHGYVGRNHFRLKGNHRLLFQRQSDHGYAFVCCSVTRIDGFVVWASAHTFPSVG